MLGGDGTILTALRRYAGTGVPVFAVNYGEVGFLATIDPNGLAHDFERAFEGEFETIELPTISVGRPTGTWSALNDISVHRKPGLRVADLAYALAGEEIGRVRCDGLVVATPQGSTGYNLANGGPILAWGVEGYVVSFIAPHSLTARALVVAPTDELTINNASREEPVEVHVDGRPTLDLPPGEDIHVGVRAHARDARPAAGRVVLPPPARAVRAARALGVADQRDVLDHPPARRVRATCRWHSSSWTSTTSPSSFAWKTPAPRQASSARAARAAHLARELIDRQPAGRGGVLARHRRGELLGGPGRGALVVAVGCVDFEGVDPGRFRAWSDRGLDREDREQDRDAEQTASTRMRQYYAQRTRSVTELHRICAKCASCRGVSGPIRRTPLVDPSACSTNCASRTSC